MIPTIICNDATQDTVDLTYDEFGSVVISTGGSVDSILRCDAGTSGIYAVTPQYPWLTQSDFYELWAAICGLLVAGYIAKRLLHVLN